MVQKNRTKNYTQNIGLVQVPHLRRSMRHPRLACTRLMHRLFFWSPRGKGGQGLPLSASLPSAPSGAEGRGVLGGSRTCCLQCSCLISRAKKSALQQNTSITLLAAGGTYLPRPLNSGRGKPGSSRSGTHVSWEWKVEGYEDLRPRPAQSNTMELEVYWEGCRGTHLPQAPE